MGCVCVAALKFLINQPEPNMSVEDDYFSHSQSSSSTIGLTISPNVLPLPAIDAGAVRRFFDGNVSSINVTITRAVLT